MLTDGPSRITVLAYDGPHIAVSMSEGRNRQLRRTFGALGYGVEELRRVAVGNYILGDLKSGQWALIAGDQGGTPA